MNSSKFHEGAALCARIAGDQKPPSVLCVLTPSRAFLAAQVNLKDLSIGQLAELRDEANTLLAERVSDRQRELPSGMQLRGEHERCFLNGL
jgi:hypothetical protein